MRRHKLDDAVFHGGKLQSPRSPSRILRRGPRPSRRRRGLSARVAAGVAQQPWSRVIVLSPAPSAPSPLPFSPLSSLCLRTCQKLFPPPPITRCPLRHS